MSDSLGRTITGYLSKAPAHAVDKKLPLILFVGGSGCQSAFTRYGDKINSGLQGLLYQLANGRARVLIVEKPGVRFLDTPERPGGAMGASREFLAEHTLPRWGTANVAALQAALTQPGIDPSRVLAAGHSEGGIVAAPCCSGVFAGYACSAAFLLRDHATFQSVGACPQPRSSGSERGRGEFAAE